MKAKQLIPILTLCFASGSRALTEEGSKAGDALVTGLLEEIKDLEAGDNGDVRSAALKQYIRQVKMALAQEDNRSISQYLDNFGEYNPSKKALEGLAVIKKSIKEEMRQKTKEVITELQGILDTARDKVTRATEPEELDKVLDSLARSRDGMNYQQGHDNNDSTIRNLLSEMGYARQFVTAWQDYLQAINSGNASKAASSLRSLASQERVLIPRSQIIARLEFERPGSEEAAKIIDAVKSPADMKGAIAKLSTMQRTIGSSDSDSSEIREALRTLARYEKTYREFLAGLPVNIESFGQSSETSDPARDLKFIQLRADLLGLILPGTLDLPDDFKPTDGEKVDDFLNRAMDSASARGDTAACRRIEKAIQIFVRSGTFSPSDSAALKGYEAGQSQMKAGQFMLAVVSLQNALKAGGSLVPSQKVGELLAQIQKEHPEEYDEGMKRVQTSPEQ